MKKIVITKDATIAKRAGIATSILGFLGSIAGVTSTILTNEPIYVYSMSAVGAFIGIAGIGLTLYAANKHGSEKELVEFNQADSPTIRVAEHKLTDIANHPDFWDSVNKLEALDVTDEVYYMTIDKADTDKIIVKSWIEHSQKTIYTLKDNDEIAR